MLNGKTAIVTGGSRGIGAAVARKLASLGADIAVIYAGNQEKAEAVCEECRTQYGVRAESFCCNVADFDAVKQTVAAVKQTFGHVEILINNAGINRDGLVAMMPEADFDAVVDTNLKGTFHMIRHCARLFIRQRRAGKLCRVQGRRHRPDQVGRQGAGREECHLQRHRARLCRDRHDRCHARFL